MARQTVGDSDWDRSLDYDIGDPFAPNGDNKRSVVKRAATSFAAGARDAFKSPSTISSMVSNMLPEGYGAVFNFAEERTREAEDLYNTAAQEMQPAMPALRRIVSRNMPKLRKYTPRFAHDAMEEFAKPQTPYRSMSAEEQNEQDLKDSLSGVFGVQNEIDAHNRAEDRIERMALHGQNLAMTRRQVRSLSAMQAGIARLVSYQDDITNRFQKRSLELQTRSYFLQRDQFRLQVETARRVNQHLIDLVKNSAMPDISKQNIAHSATNSFRQRLLGNMQDSAGSYAKRFMGDTFKRLQQNVREAAGMASEGIQASEMAEDMPIMETLFNFLGEAAVSQGGRLASGPIRSMIEKRFPGAAQTGAKASRFIRNIPQKANKWARSSTQREGLAGMFEEFAKDSVRTHRLDTTIGRHGVDSLDKPASWDRLSRKSLVEIIPGLLSRIEHNTAKLHDAKAQRQVFNFERGKFTNMDDAADDMKRRIAEPERLAASRRNVEDFIKQLAGGRPISATTMRELSRQILMDSAEGVEFDITRYTNPGINTPELSPKAKAELANVFNKQGKRADGSTDEVWMNRADQDFNTLDFGASIPTSAAGVYVSAGQQELLEKAGLLEFEGFRPKLKVSQFLDMVNAASFEDIKLKDKSAAEKLREGVVNKATSVFSSREESNDLFIPGGSVPVLTVAKLRAGQYQDAGSGETIKEWADIKGSVRDLTNGAIAVEAVVLQHGLVDSKQKVHTFLIRNTGSQKASWADGVFKKASPPPAPDDGAADVINTNSENVLLSAAKMRAGQYRDAVTNEVIDSVDKIAGPVVDENDQTVLTMADLAHLARRGGARLMGVLERAKARAHRLLRSSRATPPPFNSGSPEDAMQDQGGRTVFAEGGELIRLNTEQVELLKVIAGLLASAGSAETKEGGMFRKGILDTIFVKGIGGGWKAAKAGAKGFGTYAGSIYSGIFGAGKGIVKTGGTIGGAVFDKGMDVLRGTKDIYVQGKRKAVLTASKIKLGHYRDENSGKKVRSWKDITGPVADLTNGTTPLDQEDFDAGVYGKGPNGLVKLALGGLGTAGRAVAGGYGSLLALPFKAVGAAARAVGQGLKHMVNKQVDVYVKGESSARLLATKMKSGLYYNANSRKAGKKVHNYDDIFGEIKELPSQGAKASADDRTVLQDSEIHDPGIVNRWGMRLKTPAARILGALFGAAGSVVKGAAALFGGAMKGYGKLFGGLMGMGGGMLGAPFKFLGALLNPFEKHGARQVDLLERIHKLLDKRLPGGAPRKGSWQETLAKREEAAEEKKDEEKKLATDKKSGVGALMGWLKDKGKSWFGNKDEDEGDEEGGDDGGDGGNTYYYGGGEGEEKDDKKKDGKNKKGEAQTKGKNDRRGGRGRRRGGRATPPPIPKGAPAAAGKAGMFSRIFGGGKKLLTGRNAMLAGAVVGAGGYAMDKVGVGGDSAARQGLETAGDITNTVGTATMVGGAAKRGLPWLARIFGMGGAGAVGTGAAGTGAATAATGGTAVAGGGTAVATAPAWAIPAAIVAATVGTASFMTWQDYRGARYGKLNPIRAFRFAQYGIASTSRSLVEKVVKLEEALAPHIDGATGTVSNKASSGKDFTMNDAYELFGVHDGMMWMGGSTTDRGSFQMWYKNRFLPVFTAWTVALRGIDPSSSLSGESFKATVKMTMTSTLNMLTDTDKLPPAAKLKLVNSMWEKIDRRIYTVPASPTGDPTDIIADPNVIEQAYLLAVKECGVDGQGSKAKKMGAMFSQLADKAPLQVRMYAQWAAEKFNNKLAEKEGQTLQNKALVDAAGGSVLASGKIKLTKNLDGVLPPLLSISSRITAFQAVRLRTYGLKEMDLDRVRALVALEMFVAKNIDVSSSGNAYYRMDAESTYASAATYFGLTPNAPDDRERWGVWFNKRFLPAVAAYVTSALKLNGAADLITPEKTFKSDQLVTLAQDVMSAKNDDGNSVWSMPVSPWANGERLLTDQAAVSGSLLVLRNALGKKVVHEEKVPGQAAAAAKNKGALGNMLDAMGRGQSLANTMLGGSEGNRNWFGRTVDKVGETARTMYGHGKNAVQQAMSGDYTGALRSASQAAAAPGQAVAEGFGFTPIQQPGRGTGGDINKIAAPRDNSREEMRRVITEAAKMVGVDPDLAMVIAQKESNLVPTARNRASSAASGLFQMLTNGKYLVYQDQMKRFGGKYGINPNTSPFDPRANSLLGLELVKSNIDAFKARYKKDPTYEDVYMMHFSGTGGYFKMLDKGMDAPSTTRGSPLDVQNPGIFVDKATGQVRTVGQMINYHTKGIRDSTAALKRQGLIGAGVGGFSGVTSSVSSTANKAAPGPVSTTPAAAVNVPTTTTTTANQGGGVANAPIPAAVSARPAAVEATDMSKTGGGFAGSMNANVAAPVAAAPNLASAASLDAAAAANSRDEEVRRRGLAREQQQRAEELRATEAQNRYESQVGQQQMTQVTQIMTGVLDEAKQIRANTGDMLSVMRELLKQGSQGSSSAATASATPTSNQSSSSARLSPERPRDNFRGNVPVSVRHS